MKSYAKAQASDLLRRFLDHIRSAKEQDTADSVHNLRTGIRRLSECLRVFDIFFPKGEARKVRRELRTIMDLAGDVRNSDVAAELFAKADVLQSEKLQARHAKRKRKARAALKSKLDEWQPAEFLRRCRRALEL